MTSIEWTNETWNPVTGCTKVSAGCANCYAERMAKRLKGRYGYPKDEPFRVTLHEDRLTGPLRWRTPRMIFVCSMGDLFHADVPFDFIDRVFAVMALCPQHTFQVLTKRPERMESYINDWHATVPLERCFDRRKGCVYAIVDKIAGRYVVPRYWPLPNVWLGTSVENQQAADERIPHLLRCPAAVRFVSAEPLLGPVDLSAAWGNCSGCTDPRSEGTHQLGTRQHPSPADGPRVVDWLIMGVESRGVYVGRLPEGTEDGYWRAARSFIEQARAAGIPAFHKQAPVNGRVSHDPDDWPEDLRVREWPDASRACARGGDP